MSIIKLLNARPTIARENGWPYLIFGALPSTLAAIIIFRWGFIGFPPDTLTTFTLIGVLGLWLITIEALSNTHIVPGVVPVVLLLVGVVTAGAGTLLTIPYFPGIALLLLSSILVALHYLIATFAEFSRWIFSNF